MKAASLAVALLAIVSCRSGMREPDDVVTPTFNPPIQQSLLQQVRHDPPSGENIQYMAWSIEDHRALTPWTSSFSEADSKRSEMAGQHPLLTFTVVWRQNPAPTGGKLNFSTPNE